MILKELYVSSDRIFKSWKYLFSRPVHSDTREKKIDLYPIFTAEERNWKVREWSVRINVWLGLLGTKTWRVQINWRLLGLPRRNVIPGSGPVICPPVGGALSVTWHVQWNWAACVWPRRGRRTSWRRSPCRGLRGRPGPERRRKVLLWLRQSNAEKWRWPSLPQLRLRRIVLIITPRLW